MVAEGQDRDEERRVEWRVPPELEGRRVDFCLATNFPDRSRSFFQRLLRQNLVLRNGRACRPADKVDIGDVIEFEWPAESVRAIKGEEIDFGVIFEDEDVLVINKPPDLVVHPAQGHRTGTLVHGLLFHDQENFGELVDDEMRPGIVHRLDKDTSGVMVVAKHEESRKALKAAFRERRVEKTYLTLVIGEFGVVAGEMRKAIGRNPKNRQKMAVVQEGGKHAITKYRILGTSQGISLAQVRIETGRTHQIRVHFSDLRHPVLGDKMYGGRQRDLPVNPSRQMLHAWKLAFPHPRTGIMREYMATPPEDFQEVLATLGLPRIGDKPAPQNPDIPELIQEQTPADPE